MNTKALKQLSLAVLAGFSLLGTATAAETLESIVHTEWYVRLIADIPEEQMKDRGNVLGQLQDSIHGYDSHDLPELAPFGDTYLTIVFPHQDWDDKAGDYTSDYHAANVLKGDSWDFEVRSSSTHANVTLSWDSITVLPPKSGTEESVPPKQRIRNHRYKKQIVDTLPKRMWLEDVATGERIGAVRNGVLQTYTFNMNGTTSRSFRWVMEPFSLHPAPKVSTVKRTSPPVSAKAVTVKKEERSDTEPIAPPGEPR